MYETRHVCHVSTSVMVAWMGRSCILSVPLVAAGALHAQPYFPPGVLDSAPQGQGHGAKAGWYAKHVNCVSRKSRSIWDDGSCKSFQTCSVPWRAPFAAGCRFRFAVEIASLHASGNLALRHQIGVLQRSAKRRPKLVAADRLFWAWLCGVWSDWRYDRTTKIADTTPQQPKGMPD